MIVRPARAQLVCATLMLFAAPASLADNPRRCGTHRPDGASTIPRGDGADCSEVFTNPADRYAPPLQRFRIPVVFHVIRNNAGAMGHLSPELIQSQIDVINEDFLALAGTPGQAGAPCEIEFTLATIDPQGDPTTGITYTDSNAWFDLSDAELFTAAATLAWDAERYLNIYTARLSDDTIGYVTAYPWEPLANTPGDAVVLDYRYVGRPGLEPPYDQGRGVTHEVGHYLGLYHTFDEGCRPRAMPACYSNGDTICDTEPMASPTFGCPESRNSCGGQSSPPDPFRNYMDYTDDGCMTNFTPEQARRMRCALVNFRPLLAGVRDCNENGMEDDVDIAGGASFDCNGDRVPDECVCPAELDGDCKVTLSDLTLLLAHFGKTDGASHREGDLDRDGAVDLRDLALMLGWLGEACP